MSFKRKCLRQSQIILAKSFVCRKCNVNLKIRKGVLTCPKCKRTYGKVGDIRG